MAATAELRTLPTPDRLSEVSRAILEAFNQLDSFTADFPPELVYEENPLTFEPVTDKAIADMVQFLYSAEIDVREIRSEMKTIALWSQRMAALRADQLAEGKRS